MNQVHKNDIRPPAVANMFYPGNPKILAEEIENLLSRCEPAYLEGEIKALVCPHAGYTYSGAVAAASYNLLRGRDYSIVAIISPSHREYFPGVSVFTGKGYETPLGLAPVAMEYAEALIAKNDRIRSSWAGHRKEHALEVQLPFLQKVLKDSKILPIVMGDQEYDTCQMLGEALADVLKDAPALIIASSDLSHYHPYPQAVAIDRRTSELIAAFDDTGLMHALTAGMCEACGGGPIIAAMIASKKEGASNSRVLLYQNSGDVTGDHSAVVGYLSAAFGNLN
ncbi:MAG TPA: AmmeMemoRadiSam system protein B [bacterium]